MASVPGIPVKVNLVPSTRGTRAVPQTGVKPPWFRAAARKRGDRDYVPTDVWSEG